jgi:CheY-like chemotaxis protein
MKPTENLRGSILLIEDDPGDVIIARRAFEEVAPGITLRTAENGEDALDLLTGRGTDDGNPDRFCPDLILLDLNMSKLDGREFLQRLRAESGHTATAVVVLTTSQAPSDILQSYQDGCNSYITKPADFGEFRRIISVLTEYWFGCVRFPEPV